ncbi:MAG: 1-deoxy-D-xylulose-5-phosphate synthase N-terminal domain-containing protein [Chloroflexota bacterium]
MDQVEMLNQIQKRVLWLAMQIIHHANKVRPNPDGSKVGGHQASSASMVTIMTALYFYFLRAGDRVSIKPHASPVFHAIQYLLGQLPQAYLTELRSYGGLQAYPSRTKDPDGVDFSTGSVGLGAVAPAFSALAHQYTEAHFGDVSSRRFIAVIGDAELDEGNIWEAVLDQSLSKLGNLLWIVDLNRQSLDRVVPGIRSGQLQRLFEESGWQVLETKYGRRLQSLFNRPGGYLLRQRIDDLSNEAYQALIRLPGNELRQTLATIDGQFNHQLAAVVQHISDDDLPGVIGDLGGHDFEELLRVFAQIEAEPDKPTIIFAYTIKGWNLPLAGDPLNHSKMLSTEEMATLQTKLGVPIGEEWGNFTPASNMGQYCREVADRIFLEQSVTKQALPLDAVPASLSVFSQDKNSTQQIFGRLLTTLARDKTLAERIITVSPDVSVSTNLSGWILKHGVFTLHEATKENAAASDLMKWRHTPQGRHIELGISEMNLFMFLASFGLSAELSGQPLIPIGTVYDPFICRGLDALIYALYSGAKFIFAGTPSGITLSPEGGAHQSTVTPSLGMELPNLNAYEPCFALELEWMMLEALRQCCDRENGRATYLRLSTKQITQDLLTPALTRLGEAELKKQVLAGGYRLWEGQADGAGPGQKPIAQIITTGTMVPEAIEAAQSLAAQDQSVNVINLTSPRRLFETWREISHSQDEAPPFWWLIPPHERNIPIVTVQDGASHTLAWLGSIFGVPVIPLGVDTFGQSGTRADLYRHYEIDAQAIVNAVLKFG